MGYDRPGGSNDTPSAGAARRGTLLIVDDDLAVCRALKRALGRHFDEVLLAHDPEMAERVLEACRITHLVCDFNLGPGIPLGIDLLPGWRRANPFIKRAVVFTGTDLTDHPISPLVDRVLNKADGPDRLLEALRR
jgi:ActR/RegA family two-component response regulator